MKKDVFIEKAKKVHGDFYDYSKVDYIGCNNEVCIICPKHGEFWQKPSTHLRGHGCQKCGHIKSTTIQSQEKWIEKAKKVHNEKYDYSKVEYIGWDQKVCIICPEHGEFWQTAVYHLKGRGCPLCGSNKLTENEFVEKAIKVHGNTYDYSNLNYVNMSTRARIICQSHGEFYQVPSYHLLGNGCPMCSSEKIRKRKVVEFKNKLHEKYGDLFLFNEEEYVGGETKITFICKKHGTEHKLKPSDMLEQKNNPCNECKKENMYKEYYDIARKYEYTCDFAREKRLVYERAKEMGWLDDYFWLNNKDVSPSFNSGKTQTIYVYEFPDNIAYVGLTNNVKRRHYQHKTGINENDSVYSYSVKNNIPIPEPIILEDELTREESKLAEEKWRKTYKKNGWVMLNKVKCGSLGGTNGISWTKDEIIEESKKYKNKEDMKKNSRTAYNKMMDLGLAKECFPNSRFTVFSPKREYTEELLAELRGKYKTSGEARKYDPAFYMWLRNHNRVQDFYPKN